MILRSELLAVNHFNIYVKEQKILNSIRLYKEMKTRQRLSRCIEIPYEIINADVNLLRAKLVHVRHSIRINENNLFIFGS